MKLSYSNGDECKDCCKYSGYRFEVNLGLSDFNTPLLSIIISVEYEKDGSNMDEFGCIYLTESEIKRAHDFFLEINYHSLESLKLLKECAFIREYEYEQRNDRFESLNDQYLKNRHQVWN